MKIISQAENRGLSPVICRLKTVVCPLLFWSVPYYSGFYLRLKVSVILGEVQSVPDCFADCQVDDSGRFILWKKYRSVKASKHRLLVIGGAKRKT